VVIDVKFEGGYVPSIYEALELNHSGNKVILEVQQQLGD
jgi:F0F1-type ATP synthase beta subunit